MKNKIILTVAFVVFFLLLFCSLGFLFNLLHDFAVSQRGHTGVGGEVVVWFIPVIVYYIYRNAKDSKGTLRGGDNK